MLTAAVLSLYFLLPVSVMSLQHPPYPQSNINISHYAHAHSYSPGYTFHKRDGWESVPVSDLAYKYTQRNATNDASTTSDSHTKRERRSRTAHRKGRKDVKNLSDDISGTINHVYNAALKGIGKVEQVTITWYTGKDLKNPSCWKKSVWAPSDDSFACALTLEGWINRPKCFQFLELCSGHNKCIFVRVVDTCAGCAKGSKHVDLTKAAFQSLATLDQGTLQVKMRHATEPKEWNESLWGPRVVV
ncbi:hypothetical protein JB92DRAFT_2819135 [Gautieria morchelliformis]|nr:hypothetical protein JB92DRAFT_2819135 [Gautieria morchelliformis]